MKIYLRTTAASLCAALFASLAFAADSTPPDPCSRLRDLYSAKDYFSLREAIAAGREGSCPDLLFFQGVADNKFNRVASSIDELQEYLRHPPRTSRQDLLIEGYNVLGNDYKRTGQYGRAAEIYAGLLEKYSAVLTPNQKTECYREHRLLSACAPIRAQTVEPFGEFSVPLVEDEIGLNVPLSINGRSLTLPLDTGANFSVMTETLARRLGLHLLDKKVEVASFTGHYILARPAVAEKMTLGRATFHQVVFLVFPDTDLFVAPIQKQISGLIGFPVISALDEITFVGARSMVVSKRKSTGTAENLCLEGSSLLVAGYHDGRRLLFQWDTGATRSTLYPSFYRAFRGQIEAHGIPVEGTIRGMGDARHSRDYLLDDLSIEIAGKNVQLDHIEVLTEPASEASRFFSGDLGLDVMRQFHRTTVDFRSMSLEFD